MNQSARRFLWTCRQRSLEWRKKHQEYLKLYREEHRDRHRSYMKNYMRDYRKRKGLTKNGGSGEDKKNNENA